MTGFEPATPATRTRCATKLRYIPIKLYYHKTYVLSGALPLSQKQFTGLFLFGTVPRPDIFCLIFNIVYYTIKNFLYKILFGILVYANLTANTIFLFRKIFHCTDYYQICMKLLSIIKILLTVTKF